MFKKFFIPAGLPESIIRHIMRDLIQVCIERLAWVNLVAKGAFVFGRRLINEVERHALHDDGVRTHRTDRYSDG